MHAEQRVKANFGFTGYILADLMTQPYIDKTRELCTPTWKLQKKLQPISTAINECLPIMNDVEFLAGGIPYEAMLHEMLINTKKTLAVNHYNVMAGALVTPGVFPLFLLHDVPVAFAGKFAEVGGMLKS